MVTGDPAQGVSGVGQLGPGVSSMPSTLGEVEGFCSSLDSIIGGIRRGR